MQTTTSYSSTEFRGSDAAFSGFSCAAGDTACLPDQVADGHFFVPGHDFGLSARRAELYVGYARGFGAPDLRPGLRGDYSDVLKNVDIAPRPAGNWKLSDDFGISFGPNR